MCVCVSVCVCVCVSKREREREVSECVCVCVYTYMYVSACVRAREKNISASILRVFLLFFSILKCAWSLYEPSILENNHYSVLIIRYNYQILMFSRHPLASKRERKKHYLSHFLYIFMCVCVCVCVWVCVCVCDATIKQNLYFEWKHENNVFVRIWSWANLLSQWVNFINNFIVYKILKVWSNCLYAFQNKLHHSQVENFL